MAGTADRGITSACADATFSPCDEDAWGAEAFAPADGGGAVGAPGSSSWAHLDEAVVDGISTFVDALPDGFDLPDFDPSLHQSLGSEEWVFFDPRVEEAKRKAATIAAQLEITTRRELQTAVAWLEAFFLQNDQPATYRAIEDAAQEGLDLPTLRNMAALRDVWAQHPEWWVCRIASPGARLAQPRLWRLANGATALSWAQARRICEARVDWPVDDMIDPVWFSEWLRQTPQNRSARSFLEFVDEKIAFAREGAIAEGLLARSRAGELDEFCDRHDWLRHLPDRSDGTALSLTMADVFGARRKSDGHAE